MFRKSRAEAPTPKVPLFFKTLSHKRHHYHQPRVQLPAVNPSDLPITITSVPLAPPNLILSSSPRVNHCWTHPLQTVIIRESTYLHRLRLPLTPLYHSQKPPHSFFQRLFLSFTLPQRHTVVGSRPIVYNHISIETHSSASVCHARPLKSC